MHAMGMAYLELMQDPELLQVQMHGYAAATGDPDIAAACRRTFEVLWHMVKVDVGSGPRDDPGLLRQRHVDLGDVRDQPALGRSEPWAQSICPRKRSSRP